MEQLKTEAVLLINYKREIKMNIRKIAALSAVLVLSAQFSNATLYAVENTTRETAPETVSVQNESDDSISKDYELPVGCIVPLNIITKGTITVSDPDKVLFTSVVNSKFYDDCIVSVNTLIYGAAVGETEYQLTDDKGNFLGKGTIKIVSDTDILNDEPLIKDHARIVQTNYAASTVTGTNYTYILYDDGSLYAYNKNGDGRLTLEDRDVAAVSHTNYFRPVVYCNDGSISINGEKADIDYTAVTASKNNSAFLGSDGVVRMISVDNEGYKINELFGNVKAITKDFISTVDIIQTIDDKTMISYYDDAGYSFIDTGLKITPENIIIKDIVKASLDDRTVLKGIFYVSDSENNLYEIISDIDTSAESEQLVVKTRLIASDIQKFGYLHQKSGSTTNIPAYTDKDGNMTGVEDGTQYDSSAGAFVSDTPQYNNITPYYTANASAGGLIAIQDMKNFCVSYLGDDDTLRFSYENTFGALTNVEMTDSIFFDGKDYKILIIRKDDTLWTYNVKTGDFKMLQPENETEPAGTKYGAKDMVSMMQYIFGAENAVKEDWMDFDGNGKVNIIDLLLLKKEILRSLQ